MGDKTISTSFQTLSSDYFDKAINDGIIDAANGKTRDGDELTQYLMSQDDSLSEDDARIKGIQLMMEHSETVSLYNQVVDDLKESVRYDSFKAWSEGDANVQDGEGKTGLDRLYENAESEHRDATIGKWIENNEKFSGVKEAYDFYVQSEKDSGKKDEEIESLYEYSLRNRQSTWERDDGITDFSDLRDEFDALVAKYDGKTETEEELSEQYETYKSGLGEDETPKSYEDWKADHIEDKSWHLSKSTFESSESSLFTQYKNSVYDEDNASYDLTAENVVDHFTKSALKNSIGNLESDGVKFDVNYDNATNKVSISAYTETTTTAEDGTETVVKNPVKLSMTVGKDSANNAEAMASTGSDASTAISQITNTTKLSDIGAEADENGNYSFKINNVEFSFSGDTTVTDMMKKVNASTAGVKMTYSSLDNAFSITASKYGVDSAVDVDDMGGSSLLSAIGLKSGTLTKGENLEVEINGKTYQSNGNSIEADGSTFTFAGNVKVGEEFSINVEKDTSAIKDLIKDFVKDYNQLIEDVYKYLDEKPEKDYYFLTDSDKEDLDLTEKQEEKWEEKAKKGLLYHDNVTSTVMTGLRSALMGSVEGLDGNVFSLSSMGLKTSSDYSQHGKFAKIDETALDAAIESHLDDIEKLFTDSENGIMKKFSAALDAGVKSTGDNKGSLIRKAGLASGTSATDNELYNAIKRTKTKITSLNLRYENEQNRLWKRYSSMESLLGTMNSQQSQFMSYFQ